MENTCEYTIRGEKKRFVMLQPQISYDDAYLIGYLACDGGYVAGKRPGERAAQPFMMVSSTEKNIVEWVRDSYIPDATIYDVGCKSSKKVNAASSVFELRFSPKASAQFARFGIFCKKPNRRLVGIKNKHMYAYTAGVLEADGFITITMRKDCRTPRIRFFITHGGEQFLADLQNWLPINTTMRQHGLNVWRLQAQSTSQNMEFLSKVLPYMKSDKKRKIVSEYLGKYYVRQESGELLGG